MLIIKSNNNCKQNKIGGSMDTEDEQLRSYNRNCYLPQCRGLRSTLYHKFPMDPERCRLWLKAFDNPKLYATSHSRLLTKLVCCRHFRPEDYVHPESRYLEQVAVPSLNLKELNELDKCRQAENTDYNINATNDFSLMKSAATMDTEDEQSTPYKRKCYLPQCQGFRSTLYHKFPVDPERCKLWLKAFDNAILYATPHSRLLTKLVCCRHFRLEDYFHPDSRYLKPAAVPSLNLKMLNELDKCRQTHVHHKVIHKAGSVCKDYNLESVDNDEFIETGNTSNSSLCNDMNQTSVKTRVMQDAEDEQSSFHRKRCYLPQCHGLRSTLYHKFPANPERFKLWLEAFDNPKLYATPHSSLQKKLVCCRHFRVEDYPDPKSKYLKPKAVPSVNLKNLNELDQCRQANVDHELLGGTESDCEVISITDSDNEESNGSGHTFQDKVSPIYDSFLCNESNMNESASISFDDNIVPSSIDTEDVCQTAIKTNTGEFGKGFQLLLNEGFIQIIDAELGTQFEVDKLWLRYICRCSQCFDNKEERPVISFLELSSDLKPEMATIIEETRGLDIIWSDGHTSTYNLIELYEKLHPKQQQNSSPSSNYLLWNFQRSQCCEDLQPINFFDLIQQNNNFVYKALDRLQKTGVLIIKHLPKNDKDSLLKRSIISKLFNHLWDNFVTETRQNSSSHGTIPYTNCTFESMDKALQILTLPHYKENVKVQLVLADGFQVVEQLPETSYNYLTQFKAEYSFKDVNGYQYITNQVVITKEEDTIKRIWFSPLHLHGFNSQDFGQVYKHFKLLNDILELQKNQWNVELNNETLIILDNYRICWCLKEPSEECELNCLYMERKHYLSSLNKLKNDMIE